MGDALKKTGRKMVYSICEWGQSKPWTWAGDVGNLWRTTGTSATTGTACVDDRAAMRRWRSMRGPALERPRHARDRNGGMTDTEYRTRFSLWAEMAAPLIIGTDLRKASARDDVILENKDIIAVDQGSLGPGSGRRPATAASVFSKPLADGDRAVALYNSTDTPARISTHYRFRPVEADRAAYQFTTWSRGENRAAQHHRCNSSRLTGTVYAGCAGSPQSSDSHRPLPST